MKTLQLALDAPCKRQRPSMTLRWLAPTLLAAVLVATPLARQPSSAQTVHAAANALPTEAPELHFPVVQGR